MAYRVTVIDEDRQLLLDTELPNLAAARAAWAGMLRMLGADFPSKLTGQPIPLAASDDAWLDGLCGIEHEAGGRHWRYVDCQDGRDLVLQAEEVG